MLILDGEGNIVKNNKKLTYLSRGHFIGEISFISKESTIADVVASNQVTYIIWTKKQIDILKRDNKVFWIKLQNILLKDMINKYDCTIFFDEKMMYEVRLNILNQYVDKFVVAESLYTHSGKRKKQNSGRLLNIVDRIIGLFSHNSDYVFFSIGMLNISAKMDLARILFSFIFPLMVKKSK